MKCAYCENIGEVTREHIIPKGFIENMNTNKIITWSDKIPSKVVKTELTIKDVCQSCNNVALSRLDEYALSIIKKYNDLISIESRSIFFKYDYDLLTRWLLKVSYNSARTNDSDYDIGLYNKNKEYILNGSNRRTIIKTFVTFMEVATDNTRDDIYHLQDKRDYEVDWFRIAPFRLRSTPTYNCTLRCIIINSFAFLTVVFDEDVTIEYIESIKNAVLKSSSGFVELDTRKKVKLKKDENFWISSIISVATLKDNYLKKREPAKDNKKIYLLLSRDEVEKSDFSRLFSLKSDFLSTKEHIQESYQTLIIRVDGYNEDPRELYQIADFQSYIIQLIESFPQILWMMDLDDEFFRTVFLTYTYTGFVSELSSSNLKIVVKTEVVEKFMIKCFKGINQMLNNYAFDNSRIDNFTELFLQRLQSICLN